VCVCVCVCPSVRMATHPKKLSTLSGQIAWPLYLTMEILDENNDMGMILHFDLVSETEIATLALAFFSSRSPVHEKPPSLSHCTCTVRTDGRVICFCCLQSQNTRTCGTAGFQHDAAVLCRNRSHAAMLYVTAFVT